MTTNSASPRSSASSSRAADSIRRCTSSPSARMARSRSRCTRSATSTGLRLQPRSHALADHRGRGRGGGWSRHVGADRGRGGARDDAVRTLSAPLANPGIRPACAIVHACSRVASRNGAAGYKLMRSSHATWTLTLDPQTTSPEANREEVEKLDNRAFFRPAIIQSAAVLEAVKARPGDVEVCLYRATADLDSFCARRRPKSAVGAEESLRRGRTKESAKARKKGA
jgi:hypothetical protein